MTNFNAGDLIQPTKHAKESYKFDSLGITLPIKVIHAFQDRANGVHYVQFLSPNQYNPHHSGGLMLRTWNARNFEPYQEPKPRYRLRSLFQLRVGDKVWTPALGYVIWTAEHIIESNRWHPDGLCAVYVGQRQVWAEVRHG